MAQDAQSPARHSKVLIIGSGAREHALTWKFSQSKQISGLFVLPGNAGTAEQGTNVDLASTDVQGLLAWARHESIDLTVVGPEAPLGEGIVDAFKDEGLRIFGPTAAAARLETSKVFAKEFLKRHYIPTASFRIFDEAEALSSSLPR